MRIKDNSLGAREYAESMQMVFEKYIHISDEIHLTAKDDFALQDLWSAGKATKKGEKYTIPCDLIVTNMVPLPNVRIFVDERGWFENGVVCKFEVLLLTDEMIRVSKTTLTELMCCAEYEVGVVRLFTSRGDEILYPFAVVEGADSLAISNKIVINGELYTSTQDSIDIAMQSSVISMLSTWYGIQIALLNPQTKDCFRGCSISLKEKQKETSYPKGKRKTNYVRRVYVKRGELSRRIENHRKRKTLSWYVIGHWRRYKNGKQIFVHGYWKGILRNQMNNNDDGREREITQKV